MLGCSLTTVQKYNLFLNKQNLAGFFYRNCPKKTFRREQKYTDAGTFRKDWEVIRNISLLFVFITEFFQNCRPDAETRTIPFVS